MVNARTNVNSMAFTRYKGNKSTRVNMAATFAMRENTNVRCFTVICSCLSRVALHVVRYPLMTTARGEQRQWRFGCTRWLSLCAARIDGITYRCTAFQQAEKIIKSTKKVQFVMVPGFQITMHSHLCSKYFLGKEDWVHTSPCHRCFLTKNSRQLWLS